MLVTFDPFYIQPNINMAIQRVLNEMQEYKYMQLYNLIICKLWTLIVKSYLYILTAILYSYTPILLLLVKC